MAGREAFGERGVQRYLEVQSLLLVWFFGENSSFGPVNTPATESFEFKLKVTDSTGAGWNIVAPFVVTE